MSATPNASDTHTTAHVDRDGVKHYGIMARIVADREAATPANVTPQRAFRLEDRVARVADVRLVASGADDFCERGFVTSIAGAPLVTVAWMDPDSPSVSGYSTTLHVDLLVHYPEGA